MKRRIRWHREYLLRSKVCKLLNPRIACLRILLEESGVTVSKAPGHKSPMITL